MICPWVLENARVFVLVEASSNIGISLSQDLLDTREQALIALFGDGVLNTEHGGKDIITLNSNDQDVFDTLQTTTLTQLAQTKPCPPFKMQHLRDYAKNVRTYIEHNPTTTQGKTRHKFSQATESMLVKQGTFRRLVDGSALMVSLGSDLGDTHGDEENPFFEAGGRSADVATTLYNHFGHWEQGVRASFDPFLTRDLARNHQLPFVDYFPWFVKHKDDWNDASRLVGQYMDIAKPYIVFAYGNVVCACTN
jgi:hypothetical protein